MSAAAQPLRISHASGLRAVDRALGEMHRDVLRSGGLEGGTVRLSVLNLVSACIDMDSADLASQAVGRVAERHPLRAIIILALPDQPTGIEADLSVQCSTSGGGQVCAEQVRLNVSGEAAFHLASVVTPLLVPDTPVFLWLVGSPPIQQAFGSDAIAICERIIIDSGAYSDVAATLRTLDAELSAAGHSIAVSDMAWERGAMWRRLVAQSFDGEAMRNLPRSIDQVTIECSGTRVSAQGWLLAGWLGSRLTWTQAPPIATGARLADGVDDDNDLLRVVLHCTDGERVAIVSIERRREALHVTIDIDGGISAERAVPYQSPQTVDMVGALLESTADDPGYGKALAYAARLVTEKR